MGKTDYYRQKIKKFQLTDLPVEGNKNTSDIRKKGLLEHRSKIS